jgi:NADH/F420H2 dehydrogenase subunit C
MRLSPDEIKKAIEELLPGVSISLEGDVLIVEPKDLIPVCRMLKETERFGMDYLSNLTAVDYPKESRIGLVYHLYSMEHKHGPIALAVHLNREKPVIASATAIWRGAEYQEREAFDLFGVHFEGHPDLRRILMWDGFEGFPMRKDYVPEDQDAPSPAG